MTDIVPSLPYRDTKAQGAADFYFAINATFSFIRRRFGPGALRRYWSDLGRDYFAPVTERWACGGLAAVADYWRAFFAAEPGASVEVEQAGHGVEVRVLRCPAIAHLRAAGREIEPDFCQHCYFIGEAMAMPAGLTVRVEGGGGSCTQRYLKRESAGGEQDLGVIHRISSC